MVATSKLRPLAAAAALALCGMPGPLLAQAPVTGAADQAAVPTHGEFRAASKQDGGSSTFAHIKVAPGVKIPFSTITYRVRDAALLDGLKPGTRVEFRAERVDGENVLVAIRPRQP